jgi:small redox-active disulfide protein 2
MIVEVFGPEPPCPRCLRTLEIVKQAVKESQFNCEVKKIDAYSKTTVAKYGLVFTPAVAIDGKVFVAGRIPSVDEVKRALRATANAKEQKTEQQQITR